MCIRIGGAIVGRDLNFSKVRDLRLGNTNGEGSLLSFLEEPIDLGRGTGSMVDLLFHRFYVRNHYRDVITEIADFVEITVSSLPSLSAFDVSDSGMFLGEFFLFNPEDVFLFFCHGFHERRI